MHTEITEAYAEEHFLEILNKVEQGQSFNITTNGRPIADLRPPAKATAEVIDGLMHPKTSSISGDEVRASRHPQPGAFACSDSIRCDLF